MKRLKLVQTLSLTDDSPAHLAHARNSMHRRLTTEAKKRGLKIGPLKWSEYYAALGEEDDTPTLRIIELTADAQ